MALRARRKVFRALEKRAPGLNTSSLPHYDLLKIGIKRDYPRGVNSLACPHKLTSECSTQRPRYSIPLRQSENLAQIKLKQFVYLSIYILFIIPLYL